MHNDFLVAILFVYNIFQKGLDLINVLFAAVHLPENVAELMPQQL